MITLKKNTYGGIDWHDSKTTVTFILTENGSYDHLSEDNAKKAMMNHIISQFPEETEKIIKAFEINEPVEFPIKIGHYDANGEYIEDSYGEVITENDKVYYEDVVTIYPKELKVYTEYMFGQVSYSTYYYIEEVESPVYAVIENFLAVTKGVSSIERIYCEPFKTLEEADAYKTQFKRHDNFTTEVYIAVFDLDKINQKWYKNQLKVIEILKKQPGLLYDNTFSPWAETHYENLIKKLGGNICESYRLFL
jgi:hypothetical protein